MDKKRVKIENWSFGVDNIDKYVAPELISLRLYGQVYGHDRIEDGHNVSTSTVLNINYENREVETRNTIYELGEMNDEYMEYLVNNSIDSKFIE